MDDWVFVQQLDLTFYDGTRISWRDFTHKPTPTDSRWTWVTCHIGGSAQSKANKAGLVDFTIPHLIQVIAIGC
jgi:hypothetical protein